MALLAAMAGSNPAVVALGILHNSSGGTKAASALGFQDDSSLFGISAKVLEGHEVHRADFRFLLYMLDYLLEMLEYTQKEGSLKHGGFGFHLQGAGPQAPLTKEQVNRALEQLGLNVSLPEHLFNELVACFGDFQGGINSAKFMQYLEVCSKADTSATAGKRTKGSGKFRTIGQSKAAVKPAALKQTTALRCSDELKRMLNVIARTRYVVGVTPLQLLCVELLPLILYLCGT